MKDRRKPKLEAVAEAAFAYVHYGADLNVLIRALDVLHAHPRNGQRYPVIPSKVRP